MGEYFGVLFNKSASLSTVLWRTAKTQDVTHGSYVVFCPPKYFLKEKHADRHISNGNCHGLTPLIKKVVGVPGDAYSVDDEGVRVNGNTLHNSKPLAVDGYGRTLPVYRANKVVGKGLYLVAGETKGSFDSRYYGPIQKQWITKTAIPLL